MLMRVCWLCAQEEPHLWRPLPNPCFLCAQHVKSYLKHPFTTSSSLLNDDKGGRGGGEVKQGLMDCVSIQQREFPACRAGVLGSGDHLVGHQGLARAPSVRTTSRRKQRSMGSCKSIVQTVIPHILFPLWKDNLELWDMALRLTQASLCIPFSVHGSVVDGSTLPILRYVVWFCRCSRPFRTDQMEKQPSQWWSKSRRSHKLRVDLRCPRSRVEMR